ncbi:hypothetical protein RM549_09280 [Salegentibacter sp. F188]|uniref:Uncharacterized protein n=1 Tax=Autumnicola patrickiae TaxID=3075591 RepID=A0ABU3E1U9_9FLAO|nr:hypothetical protein [Salegentibacter sp. F188]MDT0689974.1 hypothetical protein [Salegentibacter sp. F188]
MKKSFLTLAVIALVLSFTSCKEVSAENKLETEVIESTTPTQAEVLETSAETGIDSIDVVTEVEDSISTPNEQLPIEE